MLALLVAAPTFMRRVDPTATLKPADGELVSSAQELAGPLHHCASRSAAPWAAAVAASVAALCAAADKSSAPSA